MKQNPSRHPRVPKHFQRARVHRPLESQVLTGFAEPEWPRDYHAQPMARVAASDLEEVFRLTQLRGEFNADEQAKVRWGSNVRSSSVFDVVVMEYWEACHDTGHALSVDVAFRCESDGWSFLGYTPTLEVLEDLDDLFLVDARPSDRRVASPRE